MLDAALSLLFPRHCLACDARSEDDGSPAAHLLCEGCRPFLERPSPFDCPDCGAPLQHHDSERACLACRLAPPPWRSLSAAHLYGGPLMEAIHACKFRPQPEAIPGLARLLVARLGEGSPRVDRVVGVPGHPAHYRRRGFDLAGSLALAAGLALGRPSLAGVLRRRGPARRQVGASVARRQENVRGAFVPGPLAPLGRGRRLLLVDDVLTTGATARAATRALLSAGAAEVHLAVLCRAEREL